MRQHLGSAVPDGLAVALLKRQDAEVDLKARPSDLLDPYGPPGTIPTLSIWEILDANAFTAIKSSGLITDTTVLVGPTAAVFQDLHPAVFSGAQGMPGVELHATEVANRLENRSLRWMPAPPGWNLLVAMIVLVAGIAASRLERPLPRLGLLLAASGILVMAGAGLIVWGGLLLPVLGPAGRLGADRHCLQRRRDSSSAVATTKAATNTGSLSLSCSRRRDRRSARGGR